MKKCMAVKLYIIDSLKYVKIFGRIDNDYFNGTYINVRKPKTIHNIITIWMIK